MSALLILLPHVPAPRLFLQRGKELISSPVFGLHGPKIEAKVHWSKGCLTATLRGLSFGSLGRSPGGGGGGGGDSHLTKVGSGDARRLA